MFEWNFRNGKKQIRISVYRTMTFVEILLNVAFFSDIQTTCYTATIVFPWRTDLSRIRVPILGVIECNVINHYEYIDFGDIHRHALDDVITYKILLRPQVLNQNNGWRWPVIIRFSVFPNVDCQFRRMTVWNDSKTYLSMPSWNLEI